MEEKMAEQETPKELLVNRLKKIEGQIRGIQKMVEDERQCESIITQLVAVRAAIESVGGLVLNNYMRICFHKDSETELESINSLARCVSLWGRVRVGE
jgi:DNA-binding FrmR family transcriptional regulator